MLDHTQNFLWTNLTTLMTRLRGEAPHPFNTDFSKEPEDQDATTTHAHEDMPLWDFSAQVLLTILLSIQRAFDFASNVSIWWGESAYSLCS